MTNITLYGGPARRVPRTARLVAGWFPPAGRAVLFGVRAGWIFLTVGIAVILLGSDIDT
jgi:hypothetical protein